MSGLRATRYQFAPEGAFHWARIESVGDGWLVRVQWTERSGATAGQVIDLCRPAPTIEAAEDEARVLIAELDRLSVEWDAWQSALQAVTDSCSVPLAASP